MNELTTEFLSEMMTAVKSLLAAQQTYITATSAHIDKLIALQEDSAARFHQTNDMVNTLVELVNDQRKLLLGFADRLDRMTTLHSEQAHEIARLVEQNRALMKEMMEMQKDFSYKLMALMEKISSRPTNNNIIQ